MKLNEFQKILEKRGIDLAILTNNTERKNTNFVYFARTNEINAILTINKNPTLYVSLLELSIAKKYSRIKNIKILDKKVFDDINKLKPKIIGVEKENLTLTQFINIKSKFNNTKFTDISKDIFNLRKIKTEEEIDNIKKSCKFADLVIQNAIEFAKKAKTEIELKKFIEKNILDLDLEPSFTTIVASSNNSKNPHHISDNTKLNGFTIIDLGVKYNNYCSDIARTIYVGKPRKEEVNFYNKILDIQEDCIEDDLGPKELHNKAEKILGKYLIHNLGHGVGLDVHELPRISSLSIDEFKENMVFAIEPSYYNKFGIRIEDMLLYKNHKKILLTKTLKELKII